MDVDKICQALSRILPAAVRFAAGPAHSLQLTERERASLGVADDVRLREFASGRAYAKQALAMLGVTDVELPAGPDRLPVWPEGVTGSITHARIDHHRSCVAAAVAAKGSIAALGIDLEYQPVAPDIWHYVLTGPERARLLALPVPARCTQVRHIWCAKEAAIKALGRPLDLLSLDIQHVPASGDFVAEIADHDRGGRCSLPGRTTSCDGLVMAAVAPQRLAPGAA